ncbi:MAG: conjugal transfer protein TraF [Chthonomonadales bacterium]|nr:conjugal transfer protein TraF [Chthonomonadales bacterium]
MRFRAPVVAVFALAATTAVLPAHADFTFGGNSRAFAMGGAGLAIVDRLARSNRINPAALALMNRRVRLDSASIGLRASGIPLRQAWDHLTGTPDENDASELARDFGKRDSNFGVSLAFGLRFGHVAARAEGVGKARVLPNERLEAWARNENGDVDKLADPQYEGARADFLGAAVYNLPTIEVAERVSPAGSPTRVEVGTRIKLMHAVYSHYLADRQSIIDDTAADPAPEMHGRSTLEKSGLGIDVGFLVHPRDYEGLSGALLVTNLIEPNFRFDGTDETGAARRYDLQPRSVALGTAYVEGRVVTAFDVVDITRSYGDVQARLGAEYATRGLALRAGYSSAAGFTAGFGYGFLQFAFGGRAPLEVVQTLRF